MRIQLFKFVAILSVLLIGFMQITQAQEVRIYNTAKEKLARGEQVIGGTVTSSDPNMYCSMANAGYDFLWIVWMLIHPSH